MSSQFSFSDATQSALQRNINIAWISSAILALLSGIKIENGTVNKLTGPQNYFGGPRPPLPPCGFDPDRPS